MRPTRSLTWRANLVFIAVLLTVTMTVAIGFTLQGFWPILPLAGLEVAAVALALYWVGLSGHQCQVVRIGDALVEIEKGRRFPQSRAEFPRTWARVSLSPARVAWHPSRLVIRSHGREEVIGEFLTEDERRSLASTLAGLLGWSGTKGL